jgi:tetratricopeptide (TPR) repeat protein
MIKFYFAFITFTLIFFSCKTANKAYDKGNYHEAIELAARKLQKDPYDGETKALAQNSYRQAVKSHEDKVRQLSNSASEKRFEQIYNEYRQLQNLYDLVQRYPSIQNVVKANDYTDYLVTYRDKTAEYYFQRGLSKMNENTKMAYREAYQHFRNASKYRDDSVLRNKLDETYKLAVVKVVILPMNEFMYGGGYQTNNSYLFRNFETDLIRTLRYNTNNEFVEFYSEWDARGRNVEPDEVLDLRLGRMDIGRPYDKQNTRTVSKEVVVKETVFKPDSVVKQYAKVTAQVTTTQRTMVSEGELFVTSRDGRGRILWNEVFRGQHRWQVEFTSYTGDERALSDRDKSLLNQRDFTTPREEEVIESVLRQIQLDMNQRVRNYYSRYL